MGLQQTGSFIGPVRRTSRPARVAGLAVLAAGALMAQQAQASEGGASVYLLGSGGPEAAEAPPLKGVFFANTAYYYWGSAAGGKQFPVGGNIVAGLDAKIAADFPTVLWVPSTNFAGGVLGLGAALPVGDPMANVSAVITGPLGHQFGVSASDSALIVGDPILTALLGWKSDKTSVQVSTLVNIPIGDYRDGQLANLAFHRWAVDASSALTWHDDKSGWDLSAKTGLTFNGTNPATHYKTGTELHVEASVEKTLSPAWSAGLQGFYFQQVTGDSGSGATLGPFKGRDLGAGANVAYHFMLGKMPATLRLHGTGEFDVANRLQGAAVWLDFSVPLKLVLPRAPAAR